MKIVYTDEAGDPGFPRYETPCFILSFLYINAENWGTCFERLLEMRQNLKKYGLPVRLEFHSREFFLNKKPYHKLGLNNEVREKIIDEMVNSISDLNELGLEAINVAIVKEKIMSSKYDVLDKAYIYGLTRIDNSIYFEGNRSMKKGKFMLLIDDGYLHKVRKVSRKMYRYNYVPYEDSSDSRQIKLETLVDDPLPKNSKDSYFIQVADFIAYLVSQYVYICLKKEQSPKRRKFVGDEKIQDWMEKIKPIFNMEASKKSEFDYGIVSHPQK